MSWLKVDDRFWCHPKVERLEVDFGAATHAQAVALWTIAGSWSAQNGARRLTITTLRRLVPWSPVRAAKALEAVGLWDADGDGWRFHDLENYQPWAANNLPTTSEELGNNLPTTSKKLRKNLVDRPPKPLKKSDPPIPLPLPLPSPSDSGPTDRCEGAAPLALVSPVGALPRKRSRKPPEVGPSAATWAAYAEAHEARYGVPPVRNARVNAQVAQVVSRLGAEEAPEVARFYVEHNAAWYVAKGHPVGALLADAEKLRTEWATGRRITRGDARNAEVVDEMRAQSDRIEAALQRRKEGVL